MTLVDPHHSVLCAFISIHPAISYSTCSRASDRIAANNYAFSTSSTFGITSRGKRSDGRSAAFSCLVDPIVMKRNRLLYYLLGSGIRTDFHVSNAQSLSSSLSKQIVTWHRLFVAAILPCKHQYSSPSSFVFTTFAQPFKWPSLYSIISGEFGLSLISLSEGTELLLLPCIVIELPRIVLSPNQ
jgi:hypothetical protein